MDAPIPNLDLSQIYPPTSLTHQQSRIASLKKKFKDTFGHEPDFIARSPGRVNLIGEHIDYSLYSVLPMALSDNDILIAVRSVKKNTSKDSCDTVSKVSVANVDADKFARRDFEVANVADVRIDASKHEWTNYFLSGYKGVLLELGMNQSNDMQCLVDGSVPAGAGVSSSSAFVVCSALATMTAHGGQLGKKQLTECAIQSERFVGVESGGMDQSCSVFGLTTSALLISFFPSLDVRVVAFPQEQEVGAGQERQQMCFVIAHTGVVSDKHVTAPVCYNLRVAETRVASAFMACWLQQKGRLSSSLDWKKEVRVLRHVQEQLFGGEEQQKKNNKRDMLAELNEMVKLTEEVFDKKTEGYTFEEMGAFLGMSADEVKQRYASQYPIRADTFQLYKRTRHVFSEALRVYQFEHECHQSSSSVKSWMRLGALMNESQESCARDFECSCRELDELTRVARESGALGSRLTGAGWGGCTVSLVRQKEVDGFVSALKNKYYQVQGVSPVVFVTSAGQGSCIINADEC